MSDRIFLENVNLFVTVLELKALKITQNFKTLPIIILHLN